MTLPRAFQAGAILSASLWLALGGALAPRPVHAQMASCSYDSLTEAYTFSGADIQQSHFSCSVGDKTYSLFSGAQTLSNATFAIALSQTALGPLHQLSIRQSGDFPPGTYGLTYQVMAPQPRIEEIATAALANPANQAMVSALVDEPNLVLSASYANTLGVVSEIPAIVLPPADTVHLQTSLTVAAGSSPVTLWTQTIRQVPGPLPVLGAGCVWGTSRRLRRRRRLAAGVASPKRP